MGGQIKSIYFHKGMGKYHARAYKYQRNNHIGYFDTREEAEQEIKKFHDRDPKAALWKISREQIIEITRKYGGKR